MDFSFLIKFKTVKKYVASWSKHLLELLITAFSELNCNGNITNLNLRFKVDKVWLLILYYLGHVYNLIVVVGLERGQV